MPEIHMSTDMLTDTDTLKPWMSPTPDNLSPTVQIVRQLSQATVSDHRSCESPLTTSFPGGKLPKVASSSSSSSSPSSSSSSCF